MALASTRGNGAESGLGAPGQLCPQCIGHVDRAVGHEHIVVRQSAEDQDALRDAQAHPLRVDRAEAVQRALARVVAHAHLHQVQRHGDEEQAHQVGQHKCTAAPLPHKVREAPHVAEADGIAKQCEEVGHAVRLLAAARISVFHGLPHNLGRIAALTPAPTCEELLDTPDQRATADDAGQRQAASGRDGHGGYLMGHWWGRGAKVRWSR
mmetsp:Transcript_34328/g.88014  ORF Transcript_34328/g.88014 Transcript_34328/m.88014 type:complete len:209 (+) Transcript_34328:1951-2577(+)